MKLPENKVKRIGSLFILLATFLLLTVDSFAQCEEPTVVKKEFCVGQSAIFEIEDAAANVTYGWYTDKTIATRNPGEPGTNGREFITVNTQTGPKNYYYEKEISDKIGPKFRNPVGGLSVPHVGVDKYEMSFDNTETLIINSVTVVAKMEDPSETYGVALRYFGKGIDTVYTDWVEGTTSEFLLLGSDYYKVEIPVNIEVAAGNGGFLELVSDDDKGKHVQVEDFYWWPASEYSGDSYLDGTVTINDASKTVSAKTRTPLIMDWDVTLVCPRTAITSELADVCCPEVGQNIVLERSSFATPSASTPVTVTATGSDANPNYYYYWYDAASVLVHSGKGEFSYEATTPGQYSLHVTQTPGDENTFSCYTKRSIILDIQSIFAPDDFEVCLGDPINLTGFGAEGNYDWYSEDPISNSYVVEHDVQTTDLHILEPGVHIYTVEGDVLLGNIASDGKFDFFNPETNNDPNKYPASFETGLGPAPGADAGHTQGDWITSTGQYRVANDVRAWCSTCYYCLEENYPDFWVKEDPISGDFVSRGNFFMADAVSGQSGTAHTQEFGAANPLWQLSGQSVEVGETYTFTMDVSNWNDGAAPPEIMLIVNGKALEITGGSGSHKKGPTGHPYYVMEGTKFCEWETIQATWVADSPTATITVSEVANVLMGHEFAMDDITFSTGRGRQTDDVVITVNDCNEMQARMDGTACLGDAFPLFMEKNNGFFVDWTSSDGTIWGTTESLIAYPTDNETYTARVKFPLINFIKNGDFESDKKPDFTTSLKSPTGSDVQQGQYYVGDGSSYIHAASMGAVGADYSGSGDMMLMRPSKGSIILSKEITVTKGEDYGFSVYFDHIHSGGNNCKDYSISLSVGGSEVKTFTIPCGSDWTMYDYSWNAPTTGTVTVELTMLSTDNETGLAMDNVLLAQLGRETTDDVEVKVSVCNTLSLDDDCNDSDEREVTYITDGIFMGWFDENDDFISSDDTLNLGSISASTTVTAKIGVATAPVNENGSMDQGEVGYDLTTSLQTNQMQPSDNHLFTTDASKGIGGTGGSLLNPGDADGIGGKYLVVAPSGGTDKNILNTAALSVKAGTTYAFDFSIAYLKDEAYLDAILSKAQWDGTIIGFLGEIRLEIDGVEVASYELDKSLAGNWESFNYSWIPTKNGSHVFTLVVDKLNDYGLTSQLMYGIDKVNLTPVAQVLFDSRMVEPCLPPCNKPISVAITTPDDICEGEDVVLKATYEDGGETTINGSMNYVWYEKGKTPTGYSPISGTGTVTIPGKVLSGLKSDVTYILRVEDGDLGNLNCYTEGSVNITVDPAITVDLGANKSICEYETLTLDAGEDFDSYVWTPNGEITQTISPTVSDTYSVTVTSGACSATDDNLVTIKPEPTSSWVSENDDLKYCGSVGVSLEVTDVTGADYQWSKDGADWGTNSATQTGATNGDYEVTLTLNGCTHTVEQQTVVGYDNPKYTISGGDTYCEGDDIEDIVIEFTQGSPDFNFSYTVDGANQVDVTAHTSAIYTISKPTEGVYLLTGEVSDANCKIAATTTSTQVVVNSKPTTSLSASSICADKDDIDLSLPATMNPTPSGGNFLSITPASTGSAILTGSVLTHSGNVDIYQIEYEYTDANGCKDTAFADFTVDANLSPVITGTPDDFTVCEGGNIELGTSQAFKTYTWTDASGNISADNIAAPIFNGTATAAGSPYEISVLVTDVNGCEGTTDATIIVNPIPTATIDPAGDFCENIGAIQTITAKPSTTVKSFEWTGTNGNETESTADFDPSSVSTIVANTITYTFTDDNDCSMKEPATINVTVNPKPELTINYAGYNAATGVCSYESLLEVTLSHDLVGGTISVSPTTVALNTTDGSFDPTKADAGTYTITYNYTDDKGCVGDAVTFEIVVNDRPVTYLGDNITEICYNASPVDLIAKLDDASGANITADGVFSGANTGTTFDPVAAGGEGTYTINFNYTDPTTGCIANQTSHTIDVQFIAPPVAVNASAMNTSVNSDNDVPQISATGTNISWYSDAAGITESADEVDDSDPSTYNFAFVSDGSGSMVAGAYIRYATQKNALGCESATTPVTLTITDCPVAAPKVKIHHACDGDEVKLTVESGEKEPSPNPQFGWWKNPKYLSPAPQEEHRVATGDFWDSHGFTTVGTHTVYVSEYLASHSCYGPASTVQIEVHELPNPVITDPGKICYNDGDQKISYTPQANATTTATLTVDKGILTGDMWTPEFDEDVTGVTTSKFTLNVDKVWGTAGTDVQATCSESSSLEVELTNIIAPTGTGIGTKVLHAIAGITSLPDMVINENGVGSTVSIKDIAGTEISTSLTTEMYPTHIKKEGVFVYTVTQTLNGCVSPEAESNWEVIDCPTKAPEPVSLEICEGDAIPTIASNPVGATIKKTNFKWLDESNNIISTDEDLDLSTLTAFHTVGTHTFRVSYEDDDLVNGTCRGDTATVTLQINPEPVFTLDVSNTSVICIDDADVVITPKTNFNTIIKADFDLDGDASKIVHSGIKGIIKPSDVVSVYGSHDFTVNASVEDIKGCTSTASESITIQYTEPPVTTKFFGVIPNVAQVTVSPTGTDVSYYKSSSTLDVAKIGMGSPWNIPTSGGAYSIDPTKPINTSIYATSTEQGCESERVEQEIEIINCPVPRPTVNNETICDYDDIPTLNAVTGTWSALSESGPTDFRWFTERTTDPNHASRVEIGDSYTPTSVVPNQANTWFVAQYDAGYNCMGPAAAAIISVNSSADLTLSSLKPICEGDGMPTIVAENATAMVYWFDEEPTQKPPTQTEIHISSSYTIGDAYNAAGEYTFYAVQKTNNCWSNPSEVDFKIMTIPGLPVVEGKVQCENEIVPLEATPSGSGELISWYTEDLVLLQENNSAFTPDISRLDVDGVTTFKVIASNEAGCQAEAVDVTYELVAIPAPPTFERLDYCFSNNVEEEIKAIGSNIEWYDYNSQLMPDCSNKNYCLDIYIPNSGFYPIGITQSIKGCTSNKMFYNLRFHDEPTPEILGGTGFCEGATGAVYSVINDQANSVFNWYVPEDRISYMNGTTTSLTVDWDFPGYDTLVLEKRVLYDGTYCAGYDTINIMVAESPTAEYEWSLPGAGLLAAFKNTSIQNPVFTGEEDIEVDFTSYWYFGRKTDDESKPYVQTPDSVDKTITQLYHYGFFNIGLRVENEYGCWDSTMQSIFVDLATGLYVPNAFSPTNAAHGVRLFQPVGFNLETYEIKVFDLWGNLVWYSNKLTDAGRPAEYWDGKQNGKLMRGDTYIWKIDASFLSGQVWEGAPDGKGGFKNYGTVLLIR